MKLTCVKSENIGDWYTIEKAEHEHRTWLEPMGHNAMALRCSSRISDADVEGTREEMLGIADAIEKRELSESGYRCAVDARTERVQFWSPRNSVRPGVVSLEEADELAAQIRRDLTRASLEKRDSGEEKGR